MRDTRTHSSPTKPLPGKAGILVVEYLGLGSWLYAFLMRWRFEQGYYLSGAWFLRRLKLVPVLARLARLQKLGFEEFPGLYFDVQREAVLHANDAFHSVYGCGNPLQSALLAYKSDGLLDVALRKALLVYYTLPRVKTLSCLQELCRRHGQVVFVPRDNVPFGRDRKSVV